MYTVYYDEKAKYENGRDYVKIHKSDCGHYKNDNVKNHTGELSEYQTLIKACEYVETIPNSQLSSKLFCKHCFGKSL